MSVAAAPPTSRSVRATVIATTYLGERTYVTLVVPGTAQVITACMLAPPGATRPADGSSVWLDVSGEVGIVDG